MTYSAFISYSHAADGKLAPALQFALHRFAKPWYRLRALRVFRDKASLSANPALWPSIERALAESGHFLLMASPEAARSPWVQQEIDWWLKNRSVENLLIMLTDGEIAWDGMVGDFDWNRTTALPNGLAKRFVHEPLYVDLRWAKTEDNISLRHSQFRAAVLDIAAPLHGKAKDSLDGEDVREYRKTRRLAGAATLALLVLTVSAVIGAHLAIQQKNVAEERRQVAVVHQLTARSELARTQRRSQLPRSILLATEVIKRTGAWAEGPWEAHQILNRGLTLMPRPVAAMRHDDEISGLQFTQDGRYLASASKDGTARLWEPASGFQVARMSHEGPVVALAFGSDGKVLITASKDHTHRYWRVPFGVEIERIDVPRNAGRVIAFGPSSGLATVDGNDDIWVSDFKKQLTRLTRNAAEQDARKKFGLLLSVNVLAFDAGGRYLAAGFGNTVASFLPFQSQQFGTAIWEVATKREVARFAANDAVRAVAFTPDAKYLAAGGADNKARVWHIERKEQLLEVLHDGSVATVTVSSDGKLLATGANDSTASVWDIVTGTEILRAVEDGAITSVAVSPDGSLLATGTERGMIRVWDMNPVERAVSVTHPGIIWSAAFSDTGGLLATTSTHGTTVVTSAAGVELFRIDARRDQLAAGELARLEHGEVAIGELGDLFAVLLDNGSATVWDTRRKSQVVRVDHGGKGSAMAIAEDQNLLATGGDDGIVRVWDLPSGNPRGEYRLGSMVSAVRLSIGGKSLAVGTSSGDLVLTNLITGAEVVRGRHDKVVMDVAFSNDGRWMASRGEDNVVLVWNLDNPKDVRRFTGLLQLGGGLAFSPDSGHLVAGDGEFARIWEISSGRAVVRLPMGGIVHAVAMDEQQRVIAAIGQRLAKEYRLVSHFWTTPDVIRETCRRLVSDISEIEWRHYVGDEPYRAVCPGVFTPLKIKLDEAVETAVKGSHAKALQAFEHLTQLTVALSNAPTFANAVCWKGSTHGAAKTVMPACEYAVKNAPELIRPLTLDSRGLARALTGNPTGAIADFSQFVRALENAGDVNAFVEKRMEWIASLEAGNNPFSPSVLEALRKE